MRKWRVAPIIPRMKSPFDDTPENWGVVYKDADFFVCDRGWSPIEIHRIIIGVKSGAFPIFPPNVPK